MPGCVRSIFYIDFWGLRRGKIARTLWSCVFMAGFLGYLAQKEWEDCLG